MRRITRACVGALALVVPVALVAAFLVGRALTPRADATAGVDGRTVVPVAPEAFAVDAVRQLNSPRMLDRSYRRAALSRFLDRSAQRLSDRFVPGPAFVQATGLAARQSTESTAVAQVVPLAASAVPAAHNQVRVSVWAVTVLGTGRLGQLIASWSTESLMLRPDAGGWRVVDYHSQPGPVPAATQPPTDVTTALRAVGSMRGVADVR